MSYRNAFAIVVLFLSGCAYTPPSVLNSLAPQHHQAIVVKPSSQQRISAQLSLWQKNEGQWQRVFMPFKAVLGRSGMAPEGQKLEGDGHTPSGIYPLKYSFGYLPNVSTKMDYKEVTFEDFWVDDPSSSQYNQWVKGKPQANSFEVLKRPDDLYKMAIVIGYNTDPVVAGKGSAIFMHIWKHYNHPTAGCVAISERNLRKILAKLDQSQDPVVILESL